MFQNKHITTSFIVAPILAVLSYFATDYIVSDLPSAAEDGKSYALLARPNCRYESGQCTFVNGDFEIRLSVVQANDGEVILRATSNRPIKGARVALKTADQVSNPFALLSNDDSGEVWEVKMAKEQLASQELRIATLAQESLFYGDTETTFFTYQTGFSQDKWL